MEPQAKPLPFLPHALVVLWYKYAIISIMGTLPSKGSIFNGFSYLKKWAVSVRLCSVCLLCDEANTFPLLFLALTQHLTRALWKTLKVQKGIPPSKALVPFVADLDSERVNLGCSSGSIPHLPPARKNRSELKVFFKLVYGDHNKCPH